MMNDESKTPGVKKSNTADRVPADGSSFIIHPSSFSEWHLDTRRLGRRVLVFDRVDSTNTRAADLAHDPANDGMAVLAEEQTAGRGQHGRSWWCERGTGVLLSVLLFP